MRILYVNVIEQHRGWGAEYFVDRGLRELGYSTHNIDYRAHRWTLSRHLARAPEFDVLLLQRGDRFPLALVRACRRPRLYWATELVARRRDQDLLLRSGLFDHVFVRSRPCLEAIIRRGWIPADRVSVLLSGFDQELYRKLPGVPKDIDVLFVGSLTSRRRAVLSRLTRTYRVAVGKAFSEELVRLFNRSKIVLNIHAEDHLDTETRVFEALGCGSFLLSERLSQESPFVSGEHLVEVNSIEAMVDAIGNYLEADEARRRIAAAGHLEARARHTWLERARQIADVMSDALARNPPAGPAFDHRAVRAFGRAEVLWNLLRVARTLPEIVRRGFSRLLP